MCGDGWCWLWLRVLLGEGVGEGVPTPLWAGCGVVGAEVAGVMVFCRSARRASMVSCTAPKDTVEPVLFCRSVISAVGSVAALQGDGDGGEDRDGDKRFAKERHERESEKKP